MEAMFIVVLYVRLSKSIRDQPFDPSPHKHRDSIALQMSRTLGFNAHEVQHLRLYHVNVLPPRIDRQATRGQGCPRAL